MCILMMLYCCLYFAINSTLQITEYSIYIVNQLQHVHFMIFAHSFAKNAQRAWQTTEIVDLYYITETVMQHVTINMKVLNAANQPKQACNSEALKHQLRQCSQLYQQIGLMLLCSLLPPHALAKRNQDKAAKYAFKCLDISHPVYK